MRKITIWLSEDELAALIKMALEQLRSPQEQARWILRDQLNDKEVTLVTINDERREVE